MVIFLGITMVLSNFSQILARAKAEEISKQYEIVAKSDSAVVTQGGQAILWVTLKNQGTQKWIGWDTLTDTPLRLGTINPLDRNSGFYTPNNWKATNRVHWADQKEANPGENMSFGFKVTAPAGLKTGIYQECFAPLVENEYWLNDKDIKGQDLCWNIEVTPGENMADYGAAATGISFQHLTMAPGQTQEIVFEAINTGSQNWFNDAQSKTPVHLATIEPNDKESDLYNSDSWLTKNRPARLLEEKVAPGEKGHFEFTIRIPEGLTTGEQILDKYWLVAENDSWFPRKNEQFFGVKIIIDENAPEKQEEDNKTDNNKKNDQLDSGSGSSGGGGGNDDNDDDNNIGDPVVDLKVNENDQTITIEKDESVELAWTSSKANSCTASEDWNGEKNKNGTYSETRNNITNNKKYTLSCTGNNKTVTDTVWVKVNQNTPTGIISTASCNANSHLLSIAGQANDTDHANTSHKIKFYSDQPASTGNYLGETWTNLATGNFNFSYTNSEYTNNSSQKIYAYAIDQDTNKEYSIDNAENIVCQEEEETNPSVDLLLDESDQTKTIIQGDNINLSWSSNNAINCQATWTDKTTSSGSETLTPDVDTIYTIRCNGDRDSFDEDSVEVKVTEPPYHATLSVDKTNIMADQVDTATMKFNLLDDSNNILADHEVIVRDTTHFADSTVQSQEHTYQTNAKGNIYLYNSYNLEKNEQNSDTFDFLVDGHILKTTSISYIKPPTPIAESMIYANVPQILYDNLDEALITVVLRDNQGAPITNKKLDSRCHFLDSTNESTSATYYWPVYPNSNGAQFYQLHDNTSANNNNGAICTFRTMNDAQSNLWTMVNFVEEYTALNYSLSNSVFSADKYQLINDGQDQIKISLELKDDQGNALPVNTKVDFAYGQIFDDNVTIGRNNNSYYTDQNGHIEFGITYDAAVETERKLTNMAWTYSVNGMPSNKWVKIKVVNGEDTAATLAVAKNNTTPYSSIVLTGTNNLLLAKFDLSSTGETVRLERLGLDLGGDELGELISQVYINDGNSNIAAASMDNNQAQFTNLTWTITPGTNKQFSVYADFNNMDDSGTYSGKRVEIGVDDDILLQYIGLDSAVVGTHFVNHVDGGAEAIGNTMVVHKAAPLMVKSENINNILEAGEKEVYKFGLIANNGDYEFGKFVLKYGKTGNYNIDNCSVHKSGTIVANGIIGTNSVAFSFNNAQRSPFSDYTVKCTFSGNFNNNDAFDSFIDTDSSYVVNDTFQNLASTGANIIWSDLSNNSHLDITHSPTSSDFTNGYLLQSLGHQVLIYTSSEPAVPTVDLKANSSDGPVTITAGDNLTMSWTSTNTSSCSAAWTTKTTTNDSDTINNVTTSNTYIIQCGTASDSVTVNVEQAPAPTVDLKVNTSDDPATIDSSDSVTLSWTATDATTCTASGGWSGNKNVAGGSEVILNITSNSTYTLQCAGDGGTNSDSVIVEVTEPANNDAGIIFTRSGNIYKVDLEGNNEIQLTSGGTDSSPKVGGNWVYFSRVRSGGNHNIWKMKTDGTESTKITNDEGNDTDPFLGDGKVFFKSNRVADKEYYYTSIDGGNITAFDPKNNFYLAHIGLGYHNGSEQLVTVSTAAWVNYHYVNLFDVNYLTNTRIDGDYSGTAGTNHFVWTGDGNTMIMSCSVDDACGTAGNIYSYNKSTKAKTLITAGDYPCLSSNGIQFVFVKSNGHICTINLDGTNEFDLGVTGSSPQYTAL